MCIRDSVMIREVRIHDSNTLTEGERRALVAPYEGRTLSFKELQTLKKDIYAYYVARGYIFARVFLPTQTVTDGDVDFYVRECNIARITLLGGERVRKSRRVMAWIKRLRDAKKEKEFMRILKLMQKASGFKVVAAAVPLKDNPTQLELRIQIKEDRYQGSLGVSNALLRPEVGPYVGSAGVEFRNLCMQNEKIEADVQVAYPPRELFSVSGSLGVPIGTDGFEFLGGVSVSISEPSIVPDGEPAKHSGQVSRRFRFKGAAVYPIYLGSNLEVGTELGLYKYGSNLDTYLPSMDIKDRRFPEAEQSTRYGWGRLKLRLKGSTGPLTHVLLVSGTYQPCLLYTSPSPRDRTRSRMPSSA